MRLVDAMPAEDRVMIGLESRFAATPAYPSLSRTAANTSTNIASVSRPVLVL